MRNQFLLISLILSLASTQVYAGKLNDLESASTNSKSRTSSSTSSNSDSDSNNGPGNALARGIGNAVGELIGQLIVHAVGAGISTMAYAGESSLHRYQHKKGTRLDPKDLHTAKQKALINPRYKEEYDELQELDYESSLFRKEGDPILPTIRLSSQWLSASGDINAQLYRAEAGYGLIGVSFSQNNLQEKGDSLALSNALIHYRMSFGNNFSWDLAFGSGKMNGKQEHNGSVFAMPMRYRYNKDWHFEYYPVWTDYKNGSLAEHQFSFNYHYKHLGATLGYKTWSAGSTSVDGVFTGLYLSF